jgi:flavodoxin
MNILIAYYSRKGNNYFNGSIVDLKQGNTEVIAQKIQSFTEGDLFEIDTVHEYSKDYEQCTLEAKKELNEHARPEITGKVNNMNEYDVIFVGYPNWWSTAPMAVFTFLEMYDLKGKTVLPFCTHEGSGMGRSEIDIADTCLDSVVKKGLAIRGSRVYDADKEVKQWIVESEVTIK